MVADTIFRGLHGIEASTQYCGALGHDMGLLETYWIEARLLGLDVEDFVLRNLFLLVPTSPDL